MPNAAKAVTVTKLCVLYVQMRANSIYSERMWRQTTRSEPYIADYYEIHRLLEKFQRLHVDWSFLHHVDWLLRKDMKSTLAQRNLMEDANLVQMVGLLNFRSAARDEPDRHENSGVSNSGRLCEQNGIPVVVDVVAEATQAEQDIYEARRSTTAYLTGQIIIVVVLMSVGFFALAFAVIEQVNVTSPEGSLYFIGPVLVTGSVTVCCQISAIKNKLRGDRRVSELDARRRQTFSSPNQLLSELSEPPPSYEAVVTEPLHPDIIRQISLRESNVGDETGSRLSQEHSRISPDVSSSRRLPGLTSEHSQGDHCSELEQQASDQYVHTSRPSMPSDRTRRYTSSVSSSHTPPSPAFDTSGESSCSSNASDAEQPPPSYVESLALSEQSLRTRMLEVELEQSATLPPSYTSLSLSEPNLFAQEQSDLTNLRPRTYSEPARGKRVTFLI